MKKVIFRFFNINPQGMTKDTFRESNTITDNSEN